VALSGGAMAAAAGGGGDEAKAALRDEQIARDLSRVVSAIDSKGGNAEDELTGEQRKLHVQHALTRFVVAAQRDVLLAAMARRGDAQGVGRVVNCSRDKAWLWQLVMPVERSLELSNGEFVAAQRHMLGLSPLSVGWSCKCGEPAGAGHFHTCNRVVGTATVMRHDVIANTLAALVRENTSALAVTKPSIGAGSALRVEEHERAREAAAEGKPQRLVPDVQFDDPAGQLHLATDVSVVFGESPGRVTEVVDAFVADAAAAAVAAAGGDAAGAAAASAAAASARVGVKGKGKAAARSQSLATRVAAKTTAALKTRANAKVAKYTPACKALGITFQAFVVEKKKNPLSEH
jgi:hypothetical protein